MVTGVDPLKVLTEINGIRHLFGTTYLNGKTVLTSHKYVVGKQLKRAARHSNILYVLRDEEHGDGDGDGGDDGDDDKAQINIVVYKDSNIFNEIVLKHIYRNFNSLIHFIERNGVKKVTNATGLQIPNILETEVCVKILNLEVDNVIEYKEGTKRKVADNHCIDSS
uniref:Uncharacterized protein n=1 Tax=Panulirus argus virus 1 TaxID=380624 RepID=A0A6G9HDZ2_9VIRU|nr:hypothetical protein [Panulirus argus virus 1]